MSKYRWCACHPTSTEARLIAGLKAAFPRLLLCDSWDVGPAARALVRLVEYGQLERYLCAIERGERLEADALLSELHVLGGAR